jgi:uncharacterized iron-regulated protein
MGVISYGNLRGETMKLKIDKKDCYKKDLVGDGYFGYNNGISHRILVKVKSE